MLAAHRAAVASLAVSSFVGGMLEALFLVFVTRAAWDSRTGTTRWGCFLVAGISRRGDMDCASASGHSCCIRHHGNMAIRGLCATVTAGLRTELGNAFLRANWASQHGERTGRLQELLTTFSNQGSQLVASVMQGITNGFSLVALLLSAVMIEPLASLAVIVVVIALSSVLRPLRSKVRRQAGATATTGMEFATSLSEITQLGMEMHVFNVQSQTQQRVAELIQVNARATQRMTFLRGVVPAVYTGLAYLALVGGLAVVAALDGANITSIGAVMLVMLRSLSYGQSLQSASATISASRPFLDLLQAELERYEAAALEDRGAPVDVVGTLALVDVSFEYTTDTPVLHSMNLTIGEHEVVGIVGPSGSGKSTLVQLLLALRDPTSGKVLAGGRDIRDFSQANGRERSPSFLNRLT